MKRIDFTSPEVHRNLLRFSVPALLLSVLDYLTIFINLGWLLALSGLDHLPATFRIAGLVVSIFEALFGGILAALYIHANNALGKGDHSRAQHLIRLGFGLGIAVGVAIALSGGLLTSHLLSVFDASAGVTEQVERYLSVIWWGYLVVILHLFGGLVAKMAGDIGLIIQYRLGTFLVNLVVTPVAIVYAIGNGHDALQAAAVAFIIARASGLALLVWRLRVRKVFPFRLGAEFLPKRRLAEWRPIGNLAIAETVNGFSLSLSLFLFFVIVSYFEHGTLTAVAVSQYVTGFFHVVLLGAIGTMIPFTAQNAGQQNLGNIARGVRWMVVRTFAICIPVALVYILVAPWFAGLFIHDAGALDQTVSYIRITAIPWAFLIASFPFIFAIIGLGDTRGILLLTLASMYLCNLIPMLVILRFVGDSTRLAAVGESSANLLTFACCLGYYLLRERRLGLDWGSGRAQPQPQGANP